MKIRNKILILLFTVICIIAASFLYFVKTENDKTKILIESHQSTQSNSLNNIIKFKSELLHKVVFDYTYWDEFVDFIQSKDTIWAKENINSLSISFQISASWVYNPDQKLIYFFNIIPNTDSLCNIFSEEVLNNLKKNKFCSFFIATKAGIVEISGATIHPTKDIDRNTPAKGFLIIAKLWDDKYIKELESLIASKLSFYALEKETPVSNHNIIITSDTLYGFNNKPLVKLVCEKKLDDVSLYRNLTFNSFIFLSILTLLLVIIFGVSFNYLVNRPLSIISKFLDLQDINLINKLKNKQNEFGRISNMLIESFNQKKNLEKEINERKTIQNSLLGSQKRFQAIINNAPNIAIEGYDIDGNVLFWNEAASKIFGYTEKEVIGKPISQSILDKQSFTEFLEALRQIDQTNIATEPAEWKAKTKDNKTITVLSTIFPIYLDYTDEKFFVCMDVDMSERKVLEIELQSKNEEIIAQNEELTVANEELTEIYSKIRNSEEIFRSVIEQANDGIALLDSDCKIIEWNKATESITGFTREEAIGNPIWEIEFQMLPLEKRTPQVKANIEKIVKQIAKTRTVLEKNQHIEGAIFSKKEKKLKYIQLSTFIIQTEKSFLIGRVVHDLTTISETNKTLEISEKRFRDLAELLPSVIFETDLTGKFTYLNRKAFDISGYTPQDLQNGLMFFDVIPKNRIEEAKIIFENIVVNDVSVVIDTPITPKSGNEIPCIIYPALIKDVNSNPTGIRGVLMDITEQKQAEDLHRQLEISKKTTEIKQQFLANMSHEIRTPMMGIIGMIELIYKTDISEQQKDYLETIKDSSETLLNIINDILDLSKIEAGKTEVKLTTFNIHALTRKIGTLFAALAKHKEISFLTSYSDDIPDYIIADEKKVTQIITNLVSNAVKFTRTGNITVKYSMATQANQNPQAKVEVIDTGIGISDANQEIIFSSFTQVDSSNNRNFEGTGLGLSICKKLAQLMGGEIGVISKVEEGSTFWFTFNIDTVVPEQIAKTIIISEKTGTQPLNLSILLVEDKFVNQKVIELMLKDVGCKVKIAPNGKIALDMYEPNKFDLILMDIQMPVMDGINAVKIMKHKYTQLPPIIALSANVMEGDEENYIAAGMDDYIAKPVSQIKLIEKIAKWTIYKNK